MPFINLCNAQVVFFNASLCRTGEWGDHVTLQAAADVVLHLSLPLSSVGHAHAHAHQPAIIAVRILRFMIYFTVPS